MEREPCRQGRGITLVIRGMVTTEEYNDCPPHSEEGSFNIYLGPVADGSRAMEDPYGQVLEGHTLSRTGWPPCAGIPGRHPSEQVAGLDRNPLPNSSGMGDRFAAEYALP